MNNDLIKMRQATAQVLASQKQLKNKYKAAQKASDDWYRRAQLALGKGDEDLAHEALKRRKSCAILESKIQEAKSKKDVLKARAQSAKLNLDILYRTSTRVSELVANVDTNSALEAFNKIEEKVLSMECQADAYNQLTTDDLEGKFQLLERYSVDDDLESLKKVLSGRPKKGELPPGRTAVAPNTPFPFQASEIEKELNELRRKSEEF